MLPTNSQLNKFTDVFADDDTQENVSQPISLPSSYDASLEAPTTDYSKPIRPAKGTGQQGEFRSIEEIDPKYRCLFTYSYFNLVQSRIIEDALYSDKSMVLCAPTGSGKTVAFELAILQLLMEIEDKQYSGDFKIIYMAPVKAVCNERLTEWYPKLTKLGLLCIEVTGDTEVDFTQLKPYKVIITTPEKWDMLTRRWRDHRGLVELIKLFLIDEVHILNDETRGPVLEAVVSRMKTIELAAQSAHRIEQLQKQYQGSEDITHTPAPRIRFVAVSATISNPEDVASWLGTTEKPAVFYKFGDECRPVKLKRIVEGYPCTEGTSIFKFDIILNYKLWSIIQKHYNGKPTLIFCNTRKSVSLTADVLSREITVSFNPEQKAKLTALASTLKNKKLQVLVMSGVGCHHAGLLYEERVNIERAFRNRDLPILITTTTLAMGVNLPAHLVIVKNTQQYVNGAYQEYSISTILQMVGRAGRPQFDTEATAVIMTRLSDKARYQSLVGGSEPLQSYLHKRIAENLNSEAALGTVTDVAQCVEWLRSTFLYVRAAKDPKRYLGLPPAAPMHLILKKIEELCVKAMNGLASSGLITMDEASCIESTEAGRLMSVFYLDVETMKNIMKIDGTENLERLLWLVCESHELADMHLRIDERRCLNLLNRNNASATIRFPMKGKISTRQMKLNCIIQAVLGCLHIPEPSLNQEAMKVMKIAARVCTCLVKYLSRPEFVNQQPKYFSALLNSIMLAKCIQAHLWENSPYISRQLKGIGPTFSTLLASAGITTFMLLEESHPRDLERIMNKGPPAGNVLRKQVSLLPKYQLTVTPINNKSINVQLMLLNHNHLSENMDNLTAGNSHKSYLIVGDTENNLLLLTFFTDANLMSVYDSRMNYVITRKENSEHKIMVHCVSSTIAGIDVQTEYLFQALEPLIPRESNYFHTNEDLPEVNMMRRQTNMVDMSKERKRKCEDITQCKEKKKRESNLTEKLKALKECFGKTSKEVKRDLDKTTEMSSKLLSNILDNGSSSCRKEMQNINSTEVNIIEDLTNNLTPEQIVETTMDDDNYDFIDDLQIDSILNNIESEIYVKGTTSNKNHDIRDTFSATKIPDLNYNTKLMPQKNVTDPKLINEITKMSYVSKCSGLAKDIKKNKDAKSNFSFIDLIEKKANIDKDGTASKGNDGGFSEAIKYQINNFLQRAQETKLPSLETNKLLQILDSPERTEKITGNIPLQHINESELPSLEIKEMDNTIAVSDVPEEHFSDNKTTGIAAIEQPLEQSTYTDFNTAENKNTNENLTNIRTPIQHKTQSDDINAEEVNNLENNKVSTDKTSVENIASEVQNCDDKMMEKDFMAKALVPLNNTCVSGQNLIADCSKNRIHRTDAVTVESLIPYEYEPVQNSDDKIKEKDFNTAKALIPLNNPRVSDQNLKEDCSINRICQTDTITVESLIPHKYESIRNSGDNIMEKDFNLAKALIPLKNPSVSDQNLIEDGSKNRICQANTVPVESLIPYEYKSKYIQDIGNNLNCITSDRLTRTQPNEDTNENFVSDLNKHDTLLPFSYGRKCTSSPQTSLEPYQSAYDRERYMAYSNKDPTQVNRYSYTSTKIDVCTKNIAEHQVRITRKIKVDVDITELVSREKTKIDDIRSKNNCEEMIKDSKNDEGAVIGLSKSYPVIGFKDCSQPLHEKNPNEKIGKSQNERISNDITSLTKNRSKLTFDRTVEDVSRLNETDTKEMISEAQNIKPNEENNGSDSINHKPMVCEENKGVHDVLQKYSKILVKQEAPRTPLVNKIDRNNSSNSVIAIKQVERKSNTAKLSRRPFRIRDIHTMNTDLPENIVISSGSVEPVVTTAQKNIFPELKKVQINNEIDNKVQEIKLEHHDFNVQNDDLNESPTSVSSLDLDPIQDVNDDDTIQNVNDDDNMLNPKMLLQYFSEVKDSSDIIAPPPEFCDNTSAYSPTGSIFLTNSPYDTYNFDGTEEKRQDFNNSVLIKSSCMHSPPKEVETWTLSRDDCDSSERISAAPWIVSQRVDSAQSSARDIRRGRIGEFKFVRKKPLKH